MECGSHYSECEEKMVIFGGTGESFGVQGEPPFPKTGKAVMSKWA